MTNFEYATKRIDNFIRQMNEREIKVRGMDVTFSSHNPYSHKELGYAGTLSDHLTSALTDYEMDKVNGILNPIHIRECLNQINGAYTSNIVETGETPLKKIKELSEENEKLKTNVKTQNDEIVRLQEHSDKLGNAMAVLAPYLDQMLKGHTQSIADDNPLSG